MASVKRLSAVDEAWVLMGRLMFEQKRRVHATATELELSPPQMMALRHLEVDTPSPMNGLADKLHCDNSNVTGIVDRLEARGLVERRSADHDRRVKHLVLTEQGAELSTIIGDRLSIAPAALKGLAEDDQLALRDLLRRALGD